MGAVTPFAGGKLPAIFQEMAPDADDLSAGVSGGFAVMSFRASKWRVKYQGEEHPLLNAEGDPIPSLEVVILKANPHITKNYYKEGYSEGAAEAPDCFSLDGLRPDPGAKIPQAQTCTRCPQNVFGSRMTPAGKKAKACQDNRRMAIVPINDLKNEVFGGPMLLRIPAASLAELALMGKNLKARGFPYNAVSVKIGFDMQASFPKLTFKPVRPLTEDEAVEVMALLRDDKLERILAEAVEITAEAAAMDTAEPGGVLVTEPEPEPEPEPDLLFEQPQKAVKSAAKPAAAKPVTAAKPAAAKPVTAAKPAAATSAKPAAVKPPADDLAGDSTLDTDIKGILDELDVG